MKQGNITHWVKVSKCNNLLFFAELINELLFDYSIPSNRISTLNCHYLCLDALSAINGIEYYGVPQGTLKPIMEELFSELQKDPSFNADNNPSNFFVKFSETRPIVAHKVSDMNYYDLKRTASSLNTVFFSGNHYYEGLKQQIIQIVISNDTEKQQELFRLTKSMLTELKNSGYDTRYIFKVMNSVFWNTNNPVKTPEVISDFFSAFDFEEHKYTVVFKVKYKEAKRFLKFLEDIKLQDHYKTKCTSNESKKFLKKGDDEKYLLIDRPALDPFSAEDIARMILDNNSAVYRMYDHNYMYKISSSPCGVYSEDSFYQSGANTNAVKHTKTPPDTQISESIRLVNKAFSKVSDDAKYLDIISLFSAIKFHSHSLDSFSEENQLLDFWAIFETVLDISHEHSMDRINQICLMLVPILKRRYLYSLFAQLTDDIKEYDIDMYKRIVDEAVDRNSVIRKVCEFVLLSEQKTKRNRELYALSSYPLLRERIMYYNERLNTCQKVYNFIEKHADRVRWQIMRVYRNRNLIIHNGDSMPYLALLIENLHSYVDDFLAYTIHSIAKGNDIESMNQELFISECKRRELLANNKDFITKELIEEMMQF